jgi:alpha-tubulin suppressor-like RCC1 family protein
MVAITRAITRASAVLAAGAGLALLAGGVATARPAAPSSQRVAYWGTIAGDGSAFLSPVTVTVPGPVTEISTSNSDAYALLADGSVWAWGTGTRGELGDGGTANSFRKPVRVSFPAGIRIASLSVNSGPWHTEFAIDTTGHVWGWGANGSGDMCLGKATQHHTPVRLPFSHVTAVAGAADHATYDAGGKLYSCGMGVYGELGDGSTRTSKVPVAVKGLSGASVTALVAGFGNTGALLADGRYYDWGINSAGQLGDGQEGASSSVPVPVRLPGPVAQAFEGGNAPADGQTLVLLRNGRCYAWGSNGAFQLGNGNRVSKPSPIRITPPGGVTYQAVASAGDSSYGVSAAGAVYSWGAGKFGALGDGGTGNARLPVKVQAGATALISATSNLVAVALRP